MPKLLDDPKLGLPPIVAVVGPLRSGTSAVTGVLSALGFHAGMSLKDQDGMNPTGYFEPRMLSRRLQAKFDEPYGRTQPGEDEQQQLLYGWLSHQQRSQPCQAIVMKHPILCLMGPALQAVCGRRLRVIATQRDLDASIASLQHWRVWPDDVAANWQRLLAKGRQRWIDDVPSLDVAFDDLLAQPAQTVDRIIAFTGLPVEAKRRAAAIAFVDPTLSRFRDDAAAQ